MRFRKADIDWEVNDLWYTLHEDNYTSASRKNLVKYLKLEAQILRMLSDEQLRSEGEYSNVPISNNGLTGQDVCFLMLGVLSIQEWIDPVEFPELNNILWLASQALTNPTPSVVWEELIPAIEALK